MRFTVSKKFFLLTMMALLSSPVFSKEAAPIHKELAEHTKHFTPKVYKVGEGVFSAVGWDLGNSIAIEGDDGLIIFDTGTTEETGRQALAALREFTNKPVVAVVYSHFHPDHWGGVRAFVEQADVLSGKVQIIAHETFEGNVMRQGGMLGPILTQRTAYSFGMGLPENESVGMNHGIGARLHYGTTGFIRPTKTFRDTLNITIAGVRLQFHHVPSEAPDEIAVYLPDRNILLSGETIQGPTLPNIHTLRGTKFRDPVKWVQSIDKLRTFSAAWLVPSHGQPVYGADKVEEVLRMTRDGIQYIHDQTIRLMNKGLTEEELAKAIELPPQLANYTPYLREYYGTVKHAVREIYVGYLGWFSGDPVDLDPLSTVATAKKTIQLMGGRDKVLLAAQSALNNEEYQWAAQLATHLVRIAHNDAEARQIKAQAFRQLGYASMNINWRNWYLSSAYELEGKIDALALMKHAASVFSSKEIIAQWPLSRIVSGLSVRLKSEDVLDWHTTIAITDPTTGESHALEIRHGVAQFHEKVPADPAITISGDHDTLLKLFLAGTSAKDLMKSGELTINDLPKALRFIHALDPFLQPIALTVR